MILTWKNLLTIATLLGLGSLSFYAWLQKEQASMSITPAYQAEQKHAEQIITISPSQFQGWTLPQSRPSAKKPQHPATAQ